MPAAYVPVGHVVGHEAAGGVLDFPASQSTQELMLVWREAVVASSVMYFPGEQLVQLAETAKEYFPAEQMMQDEAVVGSFAIFPAKAVNYHQTKPLMVEVFMQGAVAQR